MGNFCFNITKLSLLTAITAACPIPSKVKTLEFFIEHEALKYIWQHGPDGFGECEEVYIFGDSAGGGLALALCIKIRDNPTVRMPQRLCLISPWLDLEVHFHKKIMYSF